MNNWDLIATVYLSVAVWCAADAKDVIFLVVLCVGSIASVESQISSEIRNKIIF